jgi:hypothetical protein
LNAQLLFGDEDYDAGRTGRMVMIGSVFSIPSYLWYTTPLPFASAPAGSDARGGVW